MCSSDLSRSRSDDNELQSKRWRVNPARRKFPMAQHARSSDGWPLSGTRNSELATKRGSRPAGGFTLLEILVAMAILGVVVTTVLASFNMVFSSTERLDNSATVFETGKSALDRIVADLGNIYILQRPFYKPPGSGDPPDP